MNYFLEFAYKLLEVKTFFNEKNIAIDLDKFKSGKMKKLFIIGLMGSGKSTMSNKISSIVSHVNERQVYHLDNCAKKSKNMTKDKYLKCVNAVVFENRYKVVEGLALISMYESNERLRQQLLNNAMIIMGASALVSALRGANREKEKGLERSWLYYFYDELYRNRTRWFKTLNKIRDERINMPNSHIEKI